MADYKNKKGLYQNNNDKQQESEYAMKPSNYSRNECNTDIKSNIQKNKNNVNNHEDESQNNKTTIDRNNSAKEPTLENLNSKILKSIAQNIHKTIAFENKKYDVDLGRYANKIFKRDSGLSGTNGSNDGDIITRTTEQNKEFDHQIFNLTKLEEGQGIDLKQANKMDIKYTSTFLNSRDAMTERSHKGFGGKSIKDLPEFGTQRKNTCQAPLTPTSMTPRTIFTPRGSVINNKDYKDLVKSEIKNYALNSNLNQNSANPEKCRNIRPVSARPIGQKKPGISKSESISDSNKNCDIFHTVDKDDSVSIDINLRTKGAEQTSVNKYPYTYKPGIFFVLINKKLMGRIEPIKCNLRLATRSKWISQKQKTIIVMWIIPLVFWKPKLT